MIDIGVNFHSKQLAPHRDVIVARARDAGVLQVLATGTSESASRLALEVARAYPGFVHATAGVHPHSADHWSVQVLSELRALWALPEVVAVGECGLDFNRNFSSPANQRHAFEQQLSAALETGKPLFLHCRDAFADFHAMMAPAIRDGAHGVVHCFTGTVDEALAFVDLGLDIGITGWVTDTARGGELREAVKHIPLERLHLETDAPYLGPKNLKKRRPYNEPANLIGVAREVAALVDLPVETVCDLCTANSRRLFRLTEAH